MNNRKKTIPLRASAFLIAVLLLVLTGCRESRPLPSINSAPPTVTPVVVVPPASASPEPTASQPAPSPEPEVTAPVVSPEPEITEPVLSPEPEITEPVTSPEPEVSEPADSPAPTDSPAPEVSEPVEEPTADPYGVVAPRVGLYELDTLTAVYEKSADERMASASMSKIVTAITALRYVSPDTVFTVGTELQLVQPGASICFIAQGHRLTLYHLLMGLLLPSGCDAAFTIAVNVARTVAESPDMGDQEAVDYFCGLMNDTAAELGAVNSHFVNPDGWDHEDHYTTVRDMAIFVSCAMESETIREIVSTPEKWVVFASGENITWRNSNALLHAESPYYCPGAVGMKTGTTAGAGNCLAAVVEQDGVMYISIVSGSPTRNGRYEDTLNMLKLIPQQENETPEP